MQHVTVLLAGSESAEGGGTRPPARPLQRASQCVICGPCLLAAPCGGTVRRRVSASMESAGDQPFCSIPARGQSCTSEAAEDEAAAGRCLLALLAPARVRNHRPSICHTRRALSVAGMPPAGYHPKRMSGRQRRLSAVSWRPDASSWGAPPG